MKEPAGTAFPPKYDDKRVPVPAEQGDRDEPARTGGAAGGQPGEKIRSGSGGIRDPGRAKLLMRAPCGRSSNMWARTGG